MGAGLGTYRRAESMQQLKDYYDRLDKFVQDERARQDAEEKKRDAYYAQKREVEEEFARRRANQPKILDGEFTVIDEE